MWSDNEASIDLLGYRHLVGGVLGVVRSDALLPATIGVFGDWGSGKSSLIQMVSGQLKDDADTLVLPFNGWLFEGYEDAKTALMGTIVDALAERTTLTVKGKNLILGLVRRINFMRLAGTAARVGVGYAAGGLPGAVLGGTPELATLGTDLIEKAKDVKPQDLGGFLREQDPGQRMRRTVREFRQDFSDLLRETQVQRLVVIVDDLDRCSPDTIIETLEAIKLFLFVPKTAFIIGADERLVKYAVRRRFPELPGDYAEVGRDYLEKLVQFPIRIPPMGRTETDNYVKLLLASTCEISTHAYGQMREAVTGDSVGLDARLDNAAVAAAMSGSITQEVSEAMALAEQVTPVLAAGLLGNPRQCKRFLNTLFMRLSMATSRGVSLKRRILAKLMLLEYFRPESFKELARLQAAKRGPLVELLVLENASSDRKDEPEDEGDELSPKTGRTRTTGGKAPVASGFGILENWKTDRWLSDWLAADPHLGNEDLQPYLYFAREKLAPMGGMSVRLSPDAQDALAKLLGLVDAERTLALNRAPALSLADAAAVLEALGSRATAAEGAGGGDSPLHRMCDWVERRPELFGELITFLKSLPDTMIPLATVPRLATIASKSAEHKSQLMAVLTVWANGGNPRLKSAAATQLQKVSRS